MNEDSFFSINRLVEFGISLAVAQQMVQTMNQAMTNMQVPGAMNSMQSAPQQFYYAIIEGKQAGPFSEQELSRLIAEKKVVKKHTFETRFSKLGNCRKIARSFKIGCFSSTTISTKSIDYENKFSTNYYSHSDKFTHRLCLV